MAYTGDLLDFVQKAVSPFHTVRAAEEYLRLNDFAELKPQDDWSLEFNKKYYVKIYDSALIAFVPHENLRSGIRIAAAHTDFPCFKIKPLSQIVQGGYGRLNVEPYGGMILNTWLDRPLSIAGRIALKGKNAFSPRAELINLDKAAAVIPNLAVHMDRSVNQGKALSRQKDMLPLAFAADGGKSGGDYLLEIVAEKLNCLRQDILSYELYLYQYEKGCRLGFGGEFISAPRLDNLTSVKACVEGIIADERKSGLNMAALFDNEEVGSRTKQGAGSLVMNGVLERIYEAFGHTKAELAADIYKSFMLSVDVAHAAHPNYPEKSDVTNKPVLNKGIAIKTSASQSYAGDAQAAAVVKALCEECGAAYQEYVNNSDIPGGSTLGSIASSLLPVRTLDIGVPILAMHSARETMGGADQEALEKLVKAFFGQSD